MRRILHMILLAALLLLARSAAQTNVGCATTTVYMNALLPDSRAIFGLKPEHFRTEGKGVRVQSVASDERPRRIVFILDVGRDINPEIRNMEASLIAHVLKGARGEDSFALIVAGETGAKLRFGASRESIVAAAMQASTNTPKAGRTPAVADAIEEAAAWMDPPQPGDAIMFFGLDREQSGKTKFPRVLDTLVTQGIRLFAFMLGPSFGGYYWDDIGTDSHGRPRTQSGLAPNTESLNDLTWGSGGYVRMENTQDEQRQYKVAERLKDAEETAWRIYRAIAAPYALQVERPPAARAQPWTLLLTDPVRKKVPKAILAYPRRLPACVDSPTGKTR